MNPTNDNDTDEQADTSLQLTSTTAPGKVFARRDELAEHYKSDWHQYNLRRRQAGLPAVLESDFEARLAAARALQLETKRAGTDHLKDKQQQQSKQKTNKKKKQVAVASTSDQTKAIVQVSSQAAAYDRIKEEAAAVAAAASAVLQGPEEDEEIEAVLVEQEPQERQEVDKEHDEPPTTPQQQQQQQQQQQEEAANNSNHIEIDPHQCLFDRHLSTSVEQNVDRMQRKYGFFIPDREYLTDLTGLIGYCHEKILFGHTCLYCQRVFTTWQGCRKHMIAVRHTKFKYDNAADMEEFAVFYDFADADAEFLASSAANKKTNGKYESDDMVIPGSSRNDQAEQGDNDENGDMDYDAGEWEDISDDEAGVEIVHDDDDDDDDDDVYVGFEEEVTRMGLDVTPLGELVFPDGRIIGHRSLRRYYKQRAPHTNNSVSVLAARQAAGERLYRGRVLHIGRSASTHSGGDNRNSNALALVRAGIAPGMTAGRAGKGILVTTGAGATASYTQLSIYRYRAAMRKQRRGDLKGLKLHHKTTVNMNRMDKKHNRLMNNVSVAHAKR